jgi:hypothetical protein
MISPGCICTCRQTILYVVDRRADNGMRLHVKRYDARGRSDVTGRTTGAGDLVLIPPTPTYSLLGV